MIPLPNMGYDECLEAAKINIDLYMDDINNVRDPEKSLYLLSIAISCIEEAKKRHNSC